MGSVCNSSKTVVFRVSFSSLSSFGGISNKTPSPANVTSYYMNHITLDRIIWNIIGWWGVLFEIPPREIMRQNPCEKSWKKFKQNSYITTVWAYALAWSYNCDFVLNYHGHYKLRAPYRSLKSLNCQVVNSWIAVKDALSKSFSIPIIANGNIRKVINHNDELILCYLNWK